MALYDVFGSTLDLTAPLEEGQIVGISGPNDKSNDDLPFHQAEQILSTLPRWFSLLVQGTRVAQDEMLHYLSAISSQFGVAMVPPILLDTWEDSQIQEWSLALRQAPVSISTILVGGHWIPVVVSNQDGFHVISTEQGLSLSSNLMPDAVGVEGPMMEQIFPNDCGFQSMAWLIAVVSHQSTVSSFTYAQSCQWRQLFWHHVYINPSSRSALPVVLGGHEDDLMVAISTLLKEHGVGAEQLQDRAQAIVKKLGAEPIKNALQSSRPWQALKRIANEAKPPFRLVAPDELDRILAEKAKAGKPIGNRATKAPRSGSTNQVSIGPNDVIIPKGVFAQDDGSLMPQLQLRQVGTAAKGIIVVTEQEIQPYLASHNISNDGLAFIVLHPSTAIQTTPGQLIRFPAQCATTGEPILVSAFMIQKGKQAVQRALPTKLPKVEEVPVSTIKMLVFRDQLPMGWKEFCEAPVKNLISIAKWLQICRANGCDCELWHPAAMDDGAMAEPILDIWNRDFLTTSFKKVPPKDAQMFVCAARVQSEAFTKLCNLSGTDGLYIEPRTSDGRSHDNTYHTVWLPKAHHKEAIAAKAMSTAPTILVRVQNRYGLKASLDQAPQIHEQFRADTVFLGGAEKTIYTVGPMPWGASRSSLTAVFKTWEWHAKPIQAISKSADSRGLVWSVQATRPPPVSVVTMEHGDVLIVRKDPEQDKHAPPPTIEASVHTRKSLQPSSASSQPLRSDPWEDAAKRLPGNSMPAVASVQQVAQIEKQVEQRLLEKLDKSDDPMSEVLEPRVAALESQIRQIQDAQKNQQNQTMQLSQQVTHVQGQVEQQTHKLQHHMDAKLAEQMTMIEALLNKRSRHE